MVGFGRIEEYYEKFMLGYEHSVLMTEEGEGEDEEGREVVLVRHDDWDQETLQRAECTKVDLDRKMRLECREVGHAIGFCEELGRVVVPVVTGEEGMSGSYNDVFVVDL
ncbi:hypothetical protein NP233_g11610 [Leucocoprinus birnbaumii]|uniref:Uncharacterized protein n=1 Tax=Leucocoprinus birnbaumii TaxID=56174 RepID=A0AAD5VI43_9AGAR|nr:hypothetical protein NP233_g11610 [Leucocoprinus birnbaumii]